jgi:hypothetical protein
VIRALRLLTFNAPGTAYIREGQGACKVASGDSDQGWAAGITRTKARGKDSYKLVSQVPVPAGGHAPSGRTYTKLAGGVPGDVTDALQLTDLNFAGQFDRPFLVDETGSAVARVLGELTNVTIVLNAAREAGRRKKNAARDLQGAEARLAALEEQAQQFAALKGQRAALSEAESALERAAALEDRLERLRALVTQAGSQRVITERAESVARSWQQAADLTELTRIEQRLQALRELAAARGLGEDAVELWGERERDARRAEATAHEAIHAALVAAGQCPLCGQPVDAKAGS